MKKHNVKIIIGSDHAENPLDEVIAIKELGVFRNLEILKMWCETTPSFIFLNRKLGHLKSGYEASFIALEENSLIDITNVKTISLLCKQGKLINLNN